MLFSFLSTRVLSRNAFASSALAFRRVQPSLITRSFSVSSFALARAATTTAKSSATKAVTKKLGSKTAKKPATKKTKTKKAAPKSKKAKKKVVEKPAPRLVIKREDKPPKGPGSPYILFYVKHLAGMQRPEGEKGFDLTHRAAKEAATSWKALTEHEKQAFRDEYAAAHVEYKKKLEAYLKNTDHRAVIKEINKRRTDKGRRRLFRIKHNKPATSYFIFAEEQRTNTPGLTTVKQNQDFAREMGKKWRALSDEEKRPYKEKSNERVKAFRESQ